MEFTCETTYDRRALTAMARVLRKTVRKKHSRRSHIFGWVVAALALLLMLPLGEQPFSFGLREVVTALVALVLVLALCFEDALNAYFAGKRMLPGTEKAVVTFHEGEYESVTAAGKTQWQYDRIALLAETKDYFAFVFSASHAQVYHKRGLSGGSQEEFRRFLTEMTGKEILVVN